MAAGAGGFYACVLLVVTPDSVFGMLVSAQALVVTLFGGVASVWGPVIGAAILVPLAETLQRRARQYPARHPGRGVRRRDHRHHAAGARRAVLDHPRPAGSAAKAADPMPDRCRVSPPCRRQRPRTRARRCWRSRICRARFGGLRAVRRGQLLRRRGRDPRHHRPERRGQDDAVQRAERRARRRCGHGDARRRSRCSGQDVHQVCRMGVGRTFQVVRSFPRLPLLDNVIVGAYGAGLVRPRRDRARPMRALAPVGLQIGGRARRPADQQATAADGTGARAGRASRGCCCWTRRWPGSGREECDEVLDVLAAAAREGMTIVHHRAHDARDDAPRRPLRGARPRRACWRPARRARWSRTAR